MAKDSMWFFQKISLGLALVNGLLVAMADKKLTAKEVVDLMNIALMGIAEDIKININDISFMFNEDGSMSINLSAALVDKLNIGL